MTGWEKDLQRLLLEIVEDKLTRAGVELSEKEKSKEEQQDLERQERQQKLWIQRMLFPKVGLLVQLWIVFVVVVVILAGMDILQYHASVIVTLLGSATASIVGLLMKIVNHVFPT